MSEPAVRVTRETATDQAGVNTERSILRAVPHSGRCVPWPHRLGTANPMAWSIPPANIHHLIYPKPADSLAFLAHLGIVSDPASKVASLMAAVAPADGPELVLGLVAPVGVDLSAVAAALRMALHTVNYEALEVNVIDAAVALGKWPLANEPRYDQRANARMTFGNLTRTDIGLDGLAMVAIGDIQRHRHERNGKADKPIARAAYLIRSLKTPDEVKKLRDVYGSSCFIVAVYASRDVQLETLARQ